MSKKRWILYITLTLSMLVNSGRSQDSTVHQRDTLISVQEWFLLDPETDSVQGVSVEKTYETLLKDRPSRTVVVGVIDSGIDIEHEDLKSVIWTNEDEVAGNGVDDDKNGYVDDVHGWNFIGGKEGNVGADTYELTREYARLRDKYANIEEKKISRKDRAEFEYWKMISDRFESYKAKSKKDLADCQEQLNLYSTFYENLLSSEQLIKETYEITEINPVTVDTITSGDKQIQLAKYIIGVIFDNSTGTETLTPILEELDFIIEHNSEVCDHYKTAVEIGYNPDFDSRTIVGDDYPNLDERFYGNNDVMGPDASHGTHVAGIIAADRTNQLGIKGIADNVRIMPIRAVPNGDERDKDIANAIIYAVDNGADIVNMSFGKDYSPQKEVVDKAVAYAESKGVLLIHAAGNDKDNIDEVSNFPTRFYKNGKEAKNWIEVGASSSGVDYDLVGSFSNYGKKSVDLFAPGVEIYSTKPHDTYENADGTSMASPVAAGVAALLMSYFPELSAVQVRDILRASSRKFDDLKVIKPDTQEQVNFSQLSITGGIVNAYEAVRMAIKLSDKKVE